jgi:hypothetical protein
VDGKNGLILWTLGGAGVLFLYSAYAKQSPQAVLTRTLGVAPATPATHPVLLEPRPSTLNPALAPRVEGGTAYLFDADGNMAGVVPDVYQGTPHLYIPPKGAMSYA